ncbi:hypothetical protein V5799_013850 [Amblyomma americanum]|uniref:Uncharacterized protein n=1 Tax=Amblyomma americanum TaxID=6943 RepID=A0AAQ4E4S7_AMBAM
MVLIAMVHQVFGAVLDMRLRGLRLSIFFGALAAWTLIAVNGAPQWHTGNTLTDFKKMVDCLRKCESRNGTHHRGVPSEKMHTRTLCLSRLSFDYDHLRVPENLTTVQCSCEGQLCLPLDDYRCTTISHRYPVEYKNGTQAFIELPVGCVCATPKTSSAYTEPGRPS